MLFIGTNPFQAHGIPNARDTLRDLQKNPARTMVVVDPRRTETAQHGRRPPADPARHRRLPDRGDARASSCARACTTATFLARHCTGFRRTRGASCAPCPIDDYVRRARRAARPTSSAWRAASPTARTRLRAHRPRPAAEPAHHAQLAISRSCSSWSPATSASAGGNNLHYLPAARSSATPTSGEPQHPRTARHGMFPIAGLYPPNILPDEIEHAGRGPRPRDVRRQRQSGADRRRHAGLRASLRKLELLVVVDVAMTETARLAHYVLPAASQFEKWEATGFNLEFPENAFHLRHPLLPAARREPAGAGDLHAAAGSDGRDPARFPVLERIAAPGARVHRACRLPRRAGRDAGAQAALAAVCRVDRVSHAGPARCRTARSPRRPRCCRSRIQLRAASTPRRAARRASRQPPHASGASLFRAILDRPEGTLISVTSSTTPGRFIAHPDRRIHLAIPEMLARAARPARAPPGADHPFILMAGERRAYNANQIFRDPAWRKVDPHGAMRMHPDDARASASPTVRARAVASARGRARGHGRDRRLRCAGAWSRCRTATACATRTPRRRAGVNRLTASEHCDPLTRTPYHKYVPVRVVAADTAYWSGPRFEQGWLARLASCQRRSYVGRGKRVRPMEHQHQRPGKVWERSLSPFFRPPRLSARSPTRARRPP